MSDLANKQVHPGTEDTSYGMTLREHYAGLAMQALLSSAGITISGNSKYDGDGMSIVSSASCNYADALIVELERRDGQEAKD